MYQNMLLVMSLFDILSARLTADKCVHGLDMFQVNSLMVEGCITLCAHDILATVLPLHVSLESIFRILNATVLTHPGLGLSRLPRLLIVNVLQVALEH